MHCFGNLLRHFRIIKYKMSFENRAVLVVIGKSAFWSIWSISATAVIAESSMIRQAIETNREIDDKLTSNPENPFKEQSIQIKHKIDVMPTREMLYNWQSSYLLLYKVTMIQGSHSGLLYFFIRSL